VETQVTNDQLAELIRDGADVKTTVIDFGNAEIKRSTNAKLSLLTVSGVYSPKLGKEIEKVALQCRSSLGIEFRDMEVNPTLKRKFDGSIVRVLNAIRGRFAKRNKLFVLCDPPIELVDVLKLSGLLHTFNIVSDPSAELPNMDAVATTSGPPNALEADESHLIRKKIFHLNQTLKRTVSLEKGLDSAEKCVQRFLPANPPNVAGYQFAFSCESSEKVGGDFFDFISLGDEHLGICIGDVSGHGIDAALLMGISKKVIQIRALDAGPEASPQSVLRRANADLVVDFTRSTFVTVLYGVLHLPTGAFTYARAGHEPPYMCGPERSRVIVNESKGLPLGIDAGKIFDRVLEERTILVRPGSFVFLSTDGIAECWNPRGSKYSKERLQFALEQIDETYPCQQALDSVLKSVRDFAEGRPQEDDMTAILFKREKN